MSLAAHLMLGPRKKACEYPGQRPSDWSGPAGLAHLVPVNHLQGMVARAARPLADPSSRSDLEQSLFATSE